MSYNGEGTTYTIDAIRQEASNTYLSVLSVSENEIVPEFDKTIQNYTLDVGNEVSFVNLKATPELSTSVVYIKSDSSYVEYKDITQINLKPGTNDIYIKVISSTKSERVYKLTITRANSDENKLLTLNTNIGEISPKFDPEVNSYTLNVPIGTKYVTLSGTISDGATVTGLETYQLSVGSVTKFINVTSQSGLVNTYEVTIVRQASNDATITGIKPSVSTLNPKFSSEIGDYKIEVEGDVKNISFDVTTASTDAVVIGDGVTELFPGKNIITITVIAEDGITQQSVNIEVYKKTDINSFETDLEINVPIGNDYQIDIKYNPENTDYKEMTYVPQDTSILSVSKDGLITPNKVGDTTIKVTSTRNPALTKTITVHVINPMIETDTYIINRDTEGYEYITGMEPHTTVDEFLNNLKNERSNLQVYDSTETDIISDDVNIKTRYIVKLSINGTVYDQLVLVIKGDISGDGYVTVADINKSKNQISAKIEFDEIDKAAADINMDTYNTVADINKIKNYISGKISSLNTELYDFYNKK